MKGPKSGAPAGPKSYRATRLWPYHLAAGGALFRPAAGRAEYLLLYRAAGRRGRPYPTWHLPKGTVDAGESLEAAALREVEEESGETGRIIAYLGSLHGSWRDIERDHQVDKTSLYFLMLHTGAGSASMDDEHDAGEWRPAGEAMELLAREPKGEQAIIERAERFLQLHPRWLADAGPTAAPSGSSRSGADA